MKVDRSNVYLVAPTAVYENVPVPMESYEIVDEDGTVTYQTFQDKYPNARSSVDGSNVMFAIVVRSKFISQLEALATGNGLTFSFDADIEADIHYLDIDTAHEVLTGNEWTQDETN